MPAHCSAEHVGKKSLSNGQLLSPIDLEGNAAVDRYAKAVAKGDAAPQWQLDAVRGATDRLLAVATWIGQIGAYANHFPLPQELQTSTSRFIRDSEGVRRAQTKKHTPAKRKAEAQLTPPKVPGDLSACPRWAALPQRILARSLAANPDREPR